MAGEKIKISIGDIQNGMIHIFTENKREVFWFIGVFSALAFVASIFDNALGWMPENASSELIDSIGYARESGPIGVVSAIASVIGQYLLFERILLGKNGRAASKIGRFFGFFGLMIVTYLGVVFGFVFFILPGMFIGGRWLLSPAFFVAEGTGVFKSMGASWDHVRGNTRTILLAFIVIALLLLIVGGVGAAIVSALGFWIVTAAFDAVTSQLFSVAMIALSIAAYRLLASPAETVAQVFE